MFNLVRSDLYKIRKSFAVKMLFLFSVLCSSAMWFIAHMITTGSIDPGVTGIGFLFSDINIISILGAVAAGMFICNDYDNKAIHNAVASGKSRFTVIISKSISFFLVIGVLLLPYALAALITVSIGKPMDMQSVALGFLNIMTDQNIPALSPLIFGRFLASAFVVSLVYCSQVSICIPLSVALKKPVFVIAIYYGITLLGAQLLTLSQHNDTLDRIYALTPFGGTHTLLNLSYGLTDFLQAIAVSLCFIIVTTGIAYAIFRKSEIK